MMRDYLKLAIQNLSHRGIRSWLTTVGIFIGIAAVVAVISLGQGLQVSINDQFSRLGYDKLFLQPGTNAFSGGSSAANITDGDRKALERVQDVGETVAFSYRSARIEYKDENTFRLVLGYTIDDGYDLWQEMYGDGLIEGRWHTRGETSKAVLGYNYLVEDKIFERPVRLYDKITINGHDLEVIGFYEKIGTGQDDALVYLTRDGYERVFATNMEDDFKAIVMKVSPGADPSRVAERVKRELRNYRDRDEGDEDFQIQTTEELQQSAGAILDIINIVVIGIAFISLIVGGIGIMNTMYTSVLERTNEIGVMKAIGARNSDILFIFLLESGLLGLAGGIIGVLAGLGLAKLVEHVGTVVLGTTFLNAWWNWWLILGALLFAFIAGAVAGVLPARQASRQQAADSLRYE